MKEVVFPYYVNFGGGDSTDAEVVVKLSEKDYKRLVKSAEEEPRWSLDEDDALDDIYQKVYAAIVKQNKEVLKDDPELLEDVIDGFEEGMKITTEMVEAYLDQYRVGINFPEELKELDCEEEEEDE